MDDNFNFYDYTLNRNGVTEKAEGKRYREAELRGMTTPHLREICRKERIIHGVTGSSDRDYLIRLILYYRGLQEPQLILQPDENGQERLQTFFHRVRFLPAEGTQVSCRAKVRVYEGLSLEPEDDVTLSYVPQLANTNAVLLGEGHTICGIFHIQERPGDTNALYLTQPAALSCQESGVKKYTLYCFDGRASDVIYRIYTGQTDVLPPHMEVWPVPLLDFVVCRPKTLDFPLLLDFGSSTTSAGIYRDEYSTQDGDTPPILEGRTEDRDVRYTLFPGPDGLTPQLPSAVGVRTVSEAGEATYVFGNEALRLANISYIDEGFCTFFELKRWILDYEAEEELTDRNGRRTRVKRRDILREFFSYVIHRTENQFKCKVGPIYAVCPLHQRQLFENLFRDILSAYGEQPSYVIDESIAAIYPTITHRLEQLSDRDAQEASALVLDLGGGTADFFTCRFRMQRERVAYRVDLESSYENGAVRFSGRHLTYRLMQGLKIALAHQLPGSGIRSLDELLEEWGANLWNDIDEKGSNFVYEALQREYERAEALIPTRFHDYELSQRADYYLVKNNFFCLFQTAERVKTLVFSVQNAFPVVLSSTPVQETRINFLPMDRWKLSVQQDGGLKTRKEWTPLTLDVFTIRTLLRPDIYITLNEFLGDMYDRGTLQDFDYIKLIGSACQMDIFQETLKEFLPGRMIQFNRQGTRAKTADGMQYSCIAGGLRYFRDRKYGFVGGDISHIVPRIPYEVTAYDYLDRPITLIHALQREEEAGYVSRRMSDLTVHFLLRDTKEHLLYVFTCACTPDSFRPTTNDAVREIYHGKVAQRDTDNIEPTEAKFFAWADADRWGFFVVPFFRQGEQLMLGQETFYSFENLQWLDNFFDGTK